MVSPGFSYRSTPEARDALWQAARELCGGKDPDPELAERIRGTLEQYVALREGVLCYMGAQQFMALARIGDMTHRPGEFEQLCARLGMPGARKAGPESSRPLCWEE